MTGGQRELSIQEFLLGYIVGDGIDEVHETDEIDRRLVQLRHEVVRHGARVMRVASRGQMETITRCQCCPREDGWPCTTLRLLAQPYARHPAYRQEWRVLAAEGDLVSVEGGPVSGH